MNRKRLGRSGIVVTDICMGTMTFGLQADEKTSFAIMDRALEAGIDFFDTAEMYPVPPSAEKFGVTEQIVGKWLKEQKRGEISAPYNSSPMAIEPIAMDSHSISSMPPGKPCHYSLPPETLSSKLGVRSPAGRLFTGHRLSGSRSTTSFSRCGRRAPASR